MNINIDSVAKNAGSGLANDLGASILGQAGEAAAGLMDLPWSQSRRLFKVETPLGPNALLLDEFSGTESVSRPFSFRLTLLSEQSPLELKQLMGGLVKVTLETASKADRHFSGYVTQCSHTGSDGGFLFYGVTLGPWLEFLRHRVNHRIFQQMTVLDILRKIFADYGAFAKFEIGVQASNYKPMTLCIQYGESDLDFVSRLMEEHGIHYFFRFDEQGHVMVIEDDSTNCPRMPMRDALEFNTEPGASRNDTIDAWSSHRYLVSNRYATKTYDFKNPGDPMNASVDTNHTMGTLPVLERYEHEGPYIYGDDQGGSRFARLRIEELELKSKLFHGGGNVRSLTCGHAFELTNHYDTGPSKQDREFFVISVTHEGCNNYLAKGEDAVYRNTFSCVRKIVPYRPGRVTPKPVMRGPQTATVVGSSGDDIHTDDHGRVLIQFHWDREGRHNAESLCWVRLSSQWAGSGGGFISLPRVGTEVVVDFLEGNPDRPLITGAVYNQKHRPPWGLPNNKTQTGILTPSNNALRFEDKKGSEEVWINAQKDMRVVVTDGETHTVGGDRTKTIVKNETSLVKCDRVKSVGGNETASISGDSTIKVGLETNGDGAVSGKFGLTTLKDITLQSTSDGILIDAKTQITLVCGESSIVMTPSGITLIGPMIHLNPPS